MGVQMDQSMRRGMQRRQEGRQAREVAQEMGDLRQAGTPARRSQRGGNIGMLAQEQNQSVRRSQRENVEQSGAAAASEQNMHIGKVE